MKTKQNAADRQWEIEDAMRTLQRADQIRQNTSLMADVTKQVGSLQKMLNGGAVIKATPAKTLQRKK